VVFDRADAELFDLVRLRTDRLREHAVQPAAEHPAQQVEHRERQRPATSARTPPAQRATLVEIERDQLGVVAALLATAAGAAVEHRMDALEGEQLPEERGGDDRVPQLGERPERTAEHAVQRRVRLVLLRNLVDGFEHRDCVRQQPVLLPQHPVRLERLRLGDDVELTAAIALERDPAHRLEPAAEPARRLAHTLGDRAHLAVPLGQDRDDPIRFAQLDRAEDDPFVAIQPGHHTSVIPPPQHPMPEFPPTVGGISVRHAPFFPPTVGGIWG
jgi:hypothetical protein